MSGQPANPKAPSSESPDQHPALSVDEAAAALRVGSRTVRSLIAIEELPCFRIGRRVLVRRETLDAFMREREAEASA